MVVQLWERLMAARQAFFDYGVKRDLPLDKQARRLALLGSLYTGTWVADPRWPWALAPSTLYANARMIVKSTGSIIDLYDQFVYAGDLSSDGKPLPDGSRGAIPIDPQTGNPAANERLTVAFHQLFSMWQWRSYMSLPVKTGAIFGDCFVELIDDYEHGSVYPNIVYPGYLPDCDLELDSAGNVQRYALEYTVEVPSSTSFGRSVDAETYRYRKEVDKEAYRYYKDGKPFEYAGFGPAVQVNPYGFVPGSLFRHEIVVGGKRGMGAYERAVVQSLELNSTLSSATDYQRKQFGAPIGVIGRSGARGGKLTMPGGLGDLLSSTASGDLSASWDDLDSIRETAADSFPLLPLQPGGTFVTIDFDIGKTMEMLEFTYDKIVTENPEAEWASKLHDLSTATGPGVQKTILPIAAKVEGARKNYDPRMVQILQMATAMLGERLQRGEIPSSVTAQRQDRFKAFAGFNLDSYGHGLLDATIPTRPVFSETRLETAQWLTLAAGLPEWGLAMLGVTPEQRAEAQVEAEKAGLEMDAALTGVDQQRTGPSGPSGPSGSSGPSGASGASR